MRWRLDRPRLRRRLALSGRGAGRVGGGQAHGQCDWQAHLAIQLAHESAGEVETQRVPFGRPSGGRAESTHAALQCGAAHYQKCTKEGWLVVPAQFWRAYYSHLVCIKYLLSLRAILLWVYGTLALLTILCASTANSFVSN